MKKIFFLIVLTAFITNVWAQNVKKIMVKSAIKGCWAAIITEEEAKSSANEYGWWSAWQKIKAEKRYKTTPAIFKNVPKGKYIIVVYNPASKSFDPNAGIPEQASDGVVLQEVDIQEDKTFSLKKSDFKDWNCLSCPWLYIWDGKEFVKQTEVIKDVVGKANEQTTFTALKPSCFINKRLKIKLQEEKDEITYLNQVILKIGEKSFTPSHTSLINSTLTKLDNQYHILKKGEMIELEFEIDANIDLKQNIYLEVSGYYEPDKQFLKEIYNKYLISK
jgi:hypothetical protein